MLSMWRSKSKKTEQLAQSAKGDGASGWVAKEGKALLEGHKETLRRIADKIALPPDIYTAYYTTMFERYAALVQDLPASAHHHHAVRGGLLCHTLEVVLFALTLRQDSMFVAGSEDQIAEQSELYSFAVASAALLHDAGKLFADIEVILGGSRDKWQPLFGPMRPGQRYVFQFATGGTRSYGVHMRAAPAFIPQIIPEPGLRWLSKVPQLKRAWLSAIAGDVANGGSIAEIIVKADQESTKRSLIAMSPSPNYDQPVAAEGIETQPRSQAGNTMGDGSIPQRFVAAITALLHGESGDEMPLNRPGAAAFVTQEQVYLVSRRAVEMVKHGLVPNLPRSEEVFSQLAVSGAILRTVDGGAEHLLKVGKGDWSANLTFLVFKRQSLDPALRLPVFDGTVSSPTSATDQGVDPTEVQQQRDEQVSADKGQRALQLPTDGHVLDAREGGSYDSEGARAKPAESFARRQELSQASASVRAASASNPNTGFYEWLSQQIVSGSIEINRAGAPLHIVQECLFVVSPEMFNRFVSSHPGSTLKQVQRYALEARLHLTSSLSASSFISVRVIGDRRQTATLSGLLLTRDASARLLPDGVLPSNPHIVLDGPVEIK